MCIRDSIYPDHDTLIRTYMPNYMAYLESSDEARKEATSDNGKMQDVYKRQTEHCVVTQEGREEIRVLCFNGKALGPKYYLLEENAHQPDDLDALFVDLEPLELELTIQGLEAVSYTHLDVYKRQLYLSLV